MEFGERAVFTLARMTKAPLPIPAICSEPPSRCSVCATDRLAHLGARDFGDNANDFHSGTRMFAPYRVDIAYYRCCACGFTFTNAFDKWTPQDFRDHIYNDDYLLTDPPFAEERPLRNARLVAGLWHCEKGSTAVLDYGGGNGRFADVMNQCGIVCESMDVFHRTDEPTRGSYDLVTCFEVIEHVPHGDQADWLAGLRRFVGPAGRVLMSTLVLDRDAVVGHHYIAPRNGHISIHSGRSIRTLAEKSGLEVYSINQEMHLLRPRAAQDQCD